MNTLIITLFAISCITTLEVIAIANGLDGTLLAGAVAVIAGLGGYSARAKFGKK